MGGFTQDKSHTMFKWTWGEGEGGQGLRYGGKSGRSSEHPQRAEVMPPTTSSSLSLSSDFLSEY